MLYSTSQPSRWCQVPVNSLQHIPSTFSRCERVARPCPQCKNLDNSANNMNPSGLSLQVMQPCCTRGAMLINCCQISTAYSIRTLNNFPHCNLDTSANNMNPSNYKMCCARGAISFCQINAACSILTLKMCEHRQAPSAA